MAAMLLAQIELFPEQASTLAPKVDALFFYLLGVSGFFTVLIAALVLFFSIRYRRRAADETGKQLPNQLWLEITWTAIPFFLAMTMFAWGAVVYMDGATPPDDSMEIFVVGKQWMWYVQHQGGQRENMELHVPVGRPVKLTMISQDVIHDFAIPNFRIKQDVLPGRYSTLWFEATRTGKWPFFCAEYCGTNHSRMVGWVYVMEPAKFETWLAAPSVDGSPANRGRKLFLKLQCIACHHTGPGNRAPILEEIYNKRVPLADGSSVLVTEDYLRESILYPDAKIAAGYQPIMPSFKGQVSEPDLLDLIAFIKLLKAGETPPRTEQTPAPEVAPPK
jgi:cytochrome c oxidase subunit 2